ncbi:MAG: alpha-amylase family glycosyl hydrolase [Saprospiraceae bacterium]
MKIFSIIFLTILLFTACRQSSPTDKQSAVPVTSKPVEITGNPEWDDQAVMYEVNLRQYTPEGTFAAFGNHVDRLAKMGVDILWLMPIFPISEEKRKGTLGSYYSVSDFMETNPEFGTKQDFKNLVDKIHHAGMKVIIDWVPNHTGWGHVWLKAHPEYYTQDSMGHIIDPIDPETGKSWGWTDVADLNYDNQAMRQAQIDAMQYWLTDFDVDGFRYDVAHNVPADFWRTVSDSLRSMKSILLLGESEIPQFRNDGALDVDYGWDFHHLFNDIAKGKQHASAIDSLLVNDRIKNLKGYHIYFTSNHDENSWSGTEFERMGAADKIMDVLAFTFDGMPLLYSGQEEPLKKRLEFFEKDSIPWKNYAYADFFKTLFDLKQRNKALGNGSAGVPLEKIAVHKDVYAFEKNKDGDRVIVMLNLSAKPQTAMITKDIPAMQDIFTLQAASYKKDQKITLKPWEYRVYSTR